MPRWNEKLFLEATLTWVCADVSSFPFGLFSTFAISYSLLKTPTHCGEKADQYHPITTRATIEWKIFSSHANFQVSLRQLGDSREGCSLQRESQALRTKHLQSCTLQIRKSRSNLGRDDPANQTQGPAGAGCPFPTTHH